jgi:hypothetical protein
MEAARSLEPRRVEKKYGSERMADEVLSTAFKWLTGHDEAEYRERPSEQVAAERSDLRLPLMKEVV